MSNLPDDFAERRFEARNGAETIFDQIDTAYAPHAIAVLATALGLDNIADAANDATADALGNDGVHSDDIDHATEELDRLCRDIDAAMRVLTDEVRSHKRLLARKAAKAALAVAA